MGEWIDFFFMAGFIVGCIYIAFIAICCILDA